MKPIRHIALCILCAVLPATAWAQPPEAPPVEPHTPEMAEANRLHEFTRRKPAQVPGAVVYAFVGGDFSTAAMGVAGADWKSPELPKLQALISSMGKHIAWEAYVNPATALPLAPDAMDTTVKARIGVRDETGLQVWGEETVMLRAEITQQANKFWRIVPEKPEAIFSKTLEDASDIGLVRRIATYLAYPHEAYEWLTVQRCINQVKQLGLGMMQYTQDWDEHFPPTVITFREGIMPYLHDETLFTASGDQIGNQSYSINPRLAGHSLADVQAPAETVAIYLGHDEKLDFRFDGRTIIGFADGHVKALNAEEAKTLRWKP